MVVVGRHRKLGESFVISAGGEGHLTSLSNTVKTNYFEVEFGKERNVPVGFYQKRTNWLIRIGGDLQRED